MRYMAYFFLNINVISELTDFFKTKITIANLEELINYAELKPQEKNDRYTLYEYINIC